MEAEKKKKNARPRMGTLSFTGLWAGAYALGWGLPIAAVFAMATLFPSFINLFPDLVVMTGFIAIPGFIISVAQHLLIRRRLGQVIRHWWLWSGLGWFVGGLILNLFSIDPFSQWINAIQPPVLTATVGFGLVFLPHILIQAYLLRGRVGRAWMWPMAAIASAALFIMPIYGGTNLSNDFAPLLIFGAAGLLQGWVMGMTLLWLLGMGGAPAAEATENRSMKDSVREYDRLMLPTEDTEEAIYLSAQQRQHKRA